MLSLADPAVMSLKRAQRVQAFEPDGGETAAADSRWEFMSKANVTDKEPTAEETEQQAEKPTLPWRALDAIQSAKVTGAPVKPMMLLYGEGKAFPSASLSRIDVKRRARWMSSWTLCPLCGSRCDSSGAATWCAVPSWYDLRLCTRSSHATLQEVVTTTNVQKARTTVGDLAAEHALRAQSKMQQLKVSPDNAPGSASLQTLRAVIFNT
jgi:hypothetical protein